MVAMEQTGVELGYVTPEQHEKAGHIAQVLSQKFILPPQSFELVRTREVDGDNKLALAYAATQGIQEGNWDEIMGTYRNTANGRYMIELDGEEIDARAGMTATVYRALALQLEERETPLPDHEEIIDRTPQRSFTWLTAEPAEGIYAPVGTINIETEQPEAHMIPGYQKSPHVLFRPAVILE